ncbi:U32 family peptidase [Pseudodesulfovibrio thermohalotolerans]|uniref:peptidase U32 family protein n=1 Tax=Pseudodesulfovibrio thermohalotolerans TaxID=2880651 RepID=UPI002441F579|nr:U32 family peptidase [Pseudodesulfovibrio thermohalotolerans]WFS62406.1 U32 family peptidase [Pseudodesulfovibrio thermohalotolerans]
MPDTSPFIPELLAPAGNMEKLETAILYGADAVYLGGEGLNLRAGAGGFDRQALERAIHLAHQAGVKVYYTLNVYPRQSHMNALREQIDFLGELRPDAVIAADPGVIRLLRRELPEIPVHISTQANTSNVEAVRFWRENGAKRVNVARELRSAELAEMLDACRKQMPTMELEVFMHGAMCMAVSGRCYMSALLNDRPGNLGQCSHPCRYEYRPTSISFEERTRPGENLWEIREYSAGLTEEFSFDAPEDFAFSSPDKDGPISQPPADRALSAALDTDGWTKFFAAEDLCLLHYIEWFRRMKVASLKIEGRTKSSAYLAQVVDVYKTALTHAATGRFQPEIYLDELVNAASRPLTTGFFDPANRGAIALPPDDTEKRPVLARVLAPLASGRWLVQTKARWDASEAVEILVPGLLRPAIAAKDYALVDEKNQGVDVSHPGQRAVLICDHPDIKAGFFLRKPWEMNRID